MLTENRPFLKKWWRWNVVNISSYCLILLHNPDILDISMVKPIDCSLTQLEEITYNDKPGVYYNNLLQENFMIKN